jgi:hypothetical protein
MTETSTETPSPPLSHQDANRIKYALIKASTNIGWDPCAIAAELIKAFALVDQATVPPTS